MSTFVRCFTCHKVFQNDSIETLLVCPDCQKGSAVQPITQQPTGGMKDDSEKIRLDLLSAHWVEGVGRVLTFGAKKYHDHNWRKGLKISRLLGAAFRHLYAILRGEDYDPETGLSHWLHLSCCCMFAYEMMLTRPDLDDRYKVEIKP